MRVAFCIDNMNVGGTELNAVRTAEALLERGVELRVFTLATDGALFERYGAVGIPVESLPLGGLFSRQAMQRGRGLRHALKQHAVDILHAHDFYSNIFAAPWARAAGVRFIASRRWWEGPERRSQRWANRASYAFAHRVIANSPAVADMLLEAERVPRNRIAVVPNFLDDLAFEAPPDQWVAAQRRRLGIEKDALVVGVLASLQPIKDHATLLHAAAVLAPDFPELRVVLVGRDAGSRADLGQLAVELGIAGNVRFAGPMDSHPSPHHIFDVSALTSVSEGLPNSVLEAMAAGRPVVATRVGALADAVEPGLTGALVPPSDPAALADALRPLLGSPAERARMGEAGRARARRMWGRQAAIDHLLQVYEDVMI